MASDLTSELEALITISHAVGTNPHLIQAGGGNTSVKNKKSGLMVIKASGSTMGQMNNTKGWVAVSLDKIKKLLADSETMTLSVKDREKKIVEKLYESVSFPEGVRPSVETPMHALLDNTIIHTHPIYANALTCNPKGKEILKQLNVGDSKLPPLWVGYTDPGSVLAFTLAKEIETYKATHNETPSIIFLENHGFVCCAADTDSCISLHTEWMNAIAKHLNRSLDVDTAISNKAEYFAAMVESATSKVFTSAGKDAPKVRFSLRKELAYGAQEKHSRLFSAALTPDHVVYIGPEALIVGEDATEDTIEQGLNSFFKKWSAFPKYIVIKNHGVCLLGNSDAQLDAAEALTISAVQIYLLTDGNIQFMTQSQVDFIMNWEAEHYRAKQVK